MHTLTPLKSIEEIIFHAKSRKKPYLLQKSCKRLLDIVLSLTGLLVLSPLLLGIALLIKLFDDGPVLYTSMRIGLNNQPFRMFKFRTMRMNADALREQLRQEANLQGDLFKLENDPRVTPIGKLLRAYSLDEFPQLLNVLKGDMSLVGPRPLPADESELFETPFTLRFNVLPGVTGKWQVSGRSNLSFSDLCQLELSYVLQWNLLQDFAILLKTIPAVLMSKGAY